jgi:putative two-component system response regulator
VITAGDGMPGLDLSGASILIVDDEPANVELLTIMLKGEGFTRIVGTSDSRQAAPLFAKHRPDLLLLDIRMPYMDGFAVMDQLRQDGHGSVLPVLVLSGNDTHETRLKVFAAGARDFIGKPFDRAEVTARIRNLLEVRLLQREAETRSTVLEKLVRDRTHQLEDSRLNLLARLADAAEWRDSETGAHTARIGKYCLRLAVELGMDERTCDLLLHTSPLHDVGKIGVRDGILLKPGALTPEEWETMKAHSWIGAKILSGDESELVRTARVIALTHHERWDGSGYPRHLRAEDIPLTGRICALADVFDAIISKRCYKPAYPVERAVEEIRLGDGTQFDPTVVAAFVRALPDLAAIHRETASAVT